ncbi:unnamed protein product [Paramecium pentaurelia]|uniref:Transmembrane protein n=1 Tax=Paramecium pentaurelia TaxID=43138 RepID=A0A8S1YM17_9CILI|nr:unnamed protein product [Paramecium pentaurelia]
MQLNLRNCQLLQTILCYKLLSNRQSNSLSIDQFDIQNNDLINTSLIFTEQQSTLNQVVIKLQNIQFLENSIPNAQNSSTYLFYMICFSLQIKKFEIINSYHLQYFFLLSVSLINVEDLLYTNIIQKQRVPTSIQCLEVVVENSQLFYISGYLTLSLTNITIVNQYSIDQSFIQILSNSSVTNQRESIKLKGLNFIGNILLKKNLGQVLSQLAIYSERNQMIEIENIHFQDNSFNQLIDDPSQSSSSLLFINSQQSFLFISHLISERNALTNSTNSFIYINTNLVSIKNIFIKNHNQLIQSFWNKYFNINFYENFNQDIINQLINKVFTIQNKGGALAITTEHFTINNCFFKDILAQSSSILDIVTQGLGKIMIANCSMISAQNIFSQIGENDGAISIYSKNSHLELEFQNITFKEIQNRLTPSILSIVPSFKSNLIIFQNIVIQNCFSLVNQFIKIEFQLLNLKSNIVSMENISIQQDENSLIQYFSKMESITIYEIQKITHDNAIINLQGCNLRIQNLTFQGILLSSILKVLDTKTLQLANILIFEGQSFYPINMIHIGQTTSMQFQVVLQNIQIINLVSFDFNKIKTNLIEYFKITLDYNSCNINLQLLNQDLNVPIKIAWIFQQILLLSSQKGSLVYIQSIHSQNKIKLIQILISNNNCLECWNGIIQFDLTQYLSIYIQELYCLKNNIRNFGCIYAKSQNQQESSIKIKNSLFNMNKGTIGSAIMAQNVRISLVNLKILNNIATFQGGALYFSINNNQFKISQTILYNNKAEQGGGIYLQGNSKLNQDNFIKSWMKLNSASLLPNNLQEMPTHLSLSINNFEMKTIQKKINNQTSKILFLQPYLVIEQGKVQLTKLLMLPSNQEIINYKIYNPSQLKFENYLEEFSISYKNNFNEILPNFSNSTCEIFIQTLLNDTLIDSTNIANIEYHSESKNFDLRFLSITVDPYKYNNQTNQIQIACHLNDQSDTLFYYIEIKGFMCQLGEFYFQSGCQICQPSQGYYSVTYFFQYNTTKCSIFDQNKFQSITSNQIQLKKGYWRPNYQSDLIEYCFKFVDFCEGGWVVSDNLCLVGHIGGLCEECDMYNIRGQGNYFKNEENTSCQNCQDATNSVFPFVLTSICIDKSNKLFSSLKIRQRFVKIIFKLNQDHESILLKLFLNYLWIFSVIFTFNFLILIFIYIYQLDKQHIILYGQQYGLLFIINLQYISSLQQNNHDDRVNGVLIINNIYGVQKFNSSIISTTLLYLYVSNYASLIKQLFSLLAKRIISDIEYIQGDVSLLYNSQNHQKWIIGFVLLGLGLIGFLIPSALFLLLYIQRDKLDKIKFRKHICYLFNEYNNENYFWEWIKLQKKTVIILIMTYFETNIFLKASLLGLCLLLYQLYAVRQKPYILNNLNELDVSTGQICSIAIFFATIKYINEQQGSKSTSVLIEMILVLLCLKLSYPFIIDLLRVYYKKYKILLLSNLYDALKIINCNLSLTIYINRKLNQMKQREQKLKKNLRKLRIHLLKISKFQLEQQNYLNLLNLQSTSRPALAGLKLDTYRNQYL